MITERPKVGVAVIVAKDKKVLLGKRKNAIGEGLWAFPGGHIEYGESIEYCSEREVLEETGIKIKNIRQVTFTNDIFEKEEKHYITLFMIAEYASGTVNVMEPDKCERWEWFPWDNLPSPVFKPITNLLKQGYEPW
jgi:8-oxo-dGTP diphosphatase